MINIFIFEQKNLSVSLTSKIHCFRPTDVFHLCKLISRNSRSLYLSKTYCTYQCKLFKNIFYFLHKVNMVTIFFILNLCPSDRKTVAFSSLLIYCYCKTNCLSYCNKNMGFLASCAHGTQISKIYPMWHGRY